MKLSASLQLRSGASPTPGARLEDDGRTFVFDQFPPGDYRLRLLIRDDEDLEVAFEAERHAVVREGEVVTLDLAANGR